MVVPSLRSTLILLIVIAFAPLQAASVSKQQADLFSKKVALVQRQGDASDRAAGTHRTSFSEDEVNSWFTYEAQPLLPSGLSQPKVTIVGDGRVAGQAIVDLDAVAKQRASGGTLDPWSYLGGRVPVNVIGILHTRDGMARFELQNADIAGVPVPKPLLQQLLSHYSRSPEHPDGVSLDGAFKLPAKIRQIEVGQGQAVIIQ